MLNFLAYWTETTPASLRRFRTQLLARCEQEAIHVEYFDDIYSLNQVKSETYPVNQLGQLAVGKYVYISEESRQELYLTYKTLSAHEIDQIVAARYPRIKLLQRETGQIMVLAHELGHHYAVQQGDESEAGADAYILTLAKEMLSLADLCRLKRKLEIYSGCSLNLNQMLFTKLKQKYETTVLVRSLKRWFN